MLKFSLATAEGQTQASCYIPSFCVNVFIFDDNEIDTIKIHMTYLFINQPKMQ